MATGSGGLWKTVNNGLTYEPIFDHKNTIAIGDITVTPSNPEIVWIGTGEANGDYWGDGMYKSNDGGNTWKNMGLEDSHYIGRIRIHPNNPDIVYVAAMGHYNSQNAQRGVFKSLDGGDTWQKLNDKIPNLKVSRVEASHHFAGTAFVTFKGRHSDDFKPYIYKTTDHGQTWISIANNLPDEPINVLREDNKNPNLLFIGTDKAVYGSIDCGVNWTKMKNNMPTQPIHDLVIHPRENDLVVGTYGRGFLITDISPLQEINSQTLGSEIHLFQLESKVQWVIPQRTNGKFTKPCW